MKTKLTQQTLCECHNCLDGMLMLRPGEYGARVAEAHQYLQSHSHDGSKLPARVASLTITALQTVPVDTSKDVVIDTTFKDDRQEALKEFRAKQQAITDWKGVAA